MYIQGEGPGGLHHDEVVHISPPMRKGRREKGGGRGDELEREERIGERECRQRYRYRTHDGIS